MRQQILALVVLAAVLVPDAGALAQTASAAELRYLVRILDPHTAYREGRPAVAANPDDHELRAWWIMAAAQADHNAEALEAAREFTEAQPDSPWSWFALAAAQLEDRDHYMDSPESAKRAIDTGESIRADTLWLYARTLISAGRYEEAVEVTENQWPAPEIEADMLRQRSRALYYQVRQKPELRDEVLALSRRAVELNPESVGAVLGLAVTLQIQGELDEARTLMREARDMSPASIPVRQRYWPLLANDPELSAEEKIAVFEADIEDIVERHDRSPEVLGAGHGALRSVDAPELRAQLANEILTEHPNSVAAEWILVGQYRELRAEMAKSMPSPENPNAVPDDEIVEQYRTAVNNFLDREHFHRPTLRGDAYRSLFTISESGETPSPEELLEIVDGMVAYEGINPHISHAAGAIALAERTTYYDRAEEIAREGIEVGREKVESQRSAYRTSSDFDQAMDWMTGIMRDALGWVFFQADRIDLAEDELLAAHDLDPDSMLNLHHLGQLYEYKGDRPRAERFYILGHQVETPRSNPNTEALETLYVKEHGATDGFAEYLTELAEADAEARFSEVLESRIAEPVAMADFELRTLDGAKISSADLRGKIAVINFWGIWCYWCVIELPELQELHEQYADDPNVVVLAINNDPNPDEVGPWMDENEYTFPVAFDGGFVGASNVSLFPTTWFVDPEGRIAFKKEGWSQALLEEFGWRIEAIRQDDYR